VSGTVGDAQLQDATLAAGRGPVQRSLGWSRDYRVHGKLTGDVIGAEQIHRDSVDIVFDRAADDADAVVGGFNTSGTQFGGKDSMILAAGNMRLSRASR